MEGKKFESIKEVYNFLVEENYYPIEANKFDTDIAISILNSEFNAFLIEVLNVERTEDEILEWKTYLNEIIVLDFLRNRNEIQRQKNEEYRLQRESRHLYLKMGESTVIQNRFFSQKDFGDMVSYLLTELPIRVGYYLDSQLALTKESPSDWIIALNRCLLSLGYDKAGDIPDQIKLTYYWMQNKLSSITREIYERTNFQLIKSVEEWTIDEFNENLKQIESAKKATFRTEILNEFIKKYEQKSIEYIEFHKKDASADNEGSLNKTGLVQDKKTPVKFYALLHWVLIELGRETMFEKDENDKYPKSKIESFAKNRYNLESGQGFYRAFKEIDITNKLAIARSFGKAYKDELIRLSKNDAEVIHTLKSYPN